MNSQFAGRGKRQNQHHANRKNFNKAGTFVSNVKILRESGTPNKRVYEVVVIESGESLNRRFYPEATLQQAVKLFDGKAVHAFRFSDKELNHLPEILREQTPLGGPLGNKIGSLKKPRWCPERRAILAELHVPVNSSTQWFIDMADSALTLQEPHFGFSIDGQGEAFPKKIRGKVVEWVERLTDIFSLDAVSNPAAGGRLLAQAIVENVVGDPSHKLARYEKRLNNAPKQRPRSGHPRAKVERLRFDRTFTEGESMRFFRSKSRADQQVQKLIRTLSGDPEPRARGVVQSLRVAESLSRTGGVAEVNVDRLKRQLESISRPSRKVRSALTQLRLMRGSATARRFFSEQEMEQGEENFNLVDELIKLLEEEFEEPAQEVFSTLKKAKEFSDAGGSVELNIKEQLLKLQKIEEPSRSVRKAMKLLKDELKKMEQLPEEPFPAEDEFEDELDLELTPTEIPKRLPPLEESYRSRARRSLLGRNQRPNDRRLQNDLMHREHKARVREALIEAESNGLPKLISSELYGDLQNQTHLSERAIRRKINERIRQANVLMESVKPDFRDLSEAPQQASKKSPIETTIFEAR